MIDALALTIQGRVMLLLRRLGMRDPRAVVIYQHAISEAVRHLRDNTEIGHSASFESLLDQQFALLENALAKRPMSAPLPSQNVTVPPAEQRPAGAGAAPPESERPRRPARNLNQGTGPVVRTMEEKLKEDREPVQKLIADECVVAGLVDPDGAKRLIASMAGKSPYDAECEIAAHLRESLLQQVKTFVRKTKGGPWSSPRVQADLRNDIHHAQTVRGVLMLSRQIIKERQAWEKENGRIGILGLFSGRH